MKLLNIKQSKYQNRFDDCVAVYELQFDNNISSKVYLKKDLTISFYHSYVKDIENSNMIYFDMAIPSGSEKASYFINVKFIRAVEYIMKNIKMIRTFI